MPDIPSLKEEGHYNAGELVELITMHATSAADVPAVIEQLIAFMREYWLKKVDWNTQEYGPGDPARSKWTWGVQDDDPHDDDDPPTLPGRMPPDRLKRLLGEDEEGDEDE